MTVESQKDIDGLKEIGKIVRLTINEMKRHARVGMTTKELDDIGGQILKKYGAVPAPKTVYNFPGNTCISINHEIAHGIPGNRKIQPGDLINIDVSAELGGYFADAGHSFVMPPYNPALTRLCDYTYKTMMKVISSLKHGVKMNEIGRIIQTEAKKGGYQVIQNLCSHGVGRSLHESPNEILPYYDRHDKRVLKEGMVITIEPFLSTGADYVVEQPDGWTLCLPDRSFAAQQEHTIIITKDQPIIVTVA
ncbi:MULTISPECIES: type I methionyl aminopeptidase [Bacillales]|jgi:methionyl aminopeptidase|uniref:type I methionyl aminopeptidase n=1 Tax=Brevibacillus TaxID=55080 RepID=UPI000E36F4BF|nr:MULTISPECIES: type I methionyl aminopeptidase [Bacillales]MDT3415156.1 methionyl aminopeptidase [Brevibacillus aydinogluensis]NNV01691.1 type I methionyl aminopeptidase [Brevibacillus sp. MCWH]REK68230.1 MAG: type I methionyl aminopeptidase [Brevibacillus sp.]UFJ60934.1 type I methionyl aminopeptidase [Anoxybacillus sediminis]